MTPSFTISASYIPAVKGLDECLLTHYWLPQNVRLQVENSCWDQLAITQQMTDRSYRERKVTKVWSSLVNVLVLVPVVYLPAPWLQYSLCVCGCMNSSVCMCLYTCGGEESMTNVFLRYFPPYVLRQVLSVSLELAA